MRPSVVRSVGDSGASWDMRNTLPVLVASQNGHLLYDLEGHFASRHVTTGGSLMSHTDTALPVSLDRASETPLAVQLADALREAAATGHLRGGDRLPSTRALAGRLRVSRTVTSAAYEQLHAEGWIAGRHGSGTYVTTSPPGDRPIGGAVFGDDREAADLLDLTPGVPWAAGLD